MRKTLIIFLLAALQTANALDTNPLYVSLSDAMSAAKTHDDKQARAHLATLRRHLEALPESADDKGRSVLEALGQAEQHPDNHHLAVLAKALYAFEKAHKPIDEARLRQTFADNVLPTYAQLDQAIGGGDIAAIRAAGKHFGKTWARHERAVRDLSPAHYGQIETAISRMRIAIVAAAPDLAAIRRHAQTLGTALKDFAHKRQ